MRLDSANRSFLLLTGVALLLGMYVLWGAIGTVLAPLALSRISHGGFGVALRQRWLLGAGPAAVLAKCLTRSDGSRRICCATGEK